MEPPLGSKEALTTGSKTAAASCGSESCFHGLLEPLCVRQQAASFLPKTALGSSWGVPGLLEPP